MEMVEFRSGNDTCKGVLTMPEGAKGNVPLVIMAGGWCYTKEIVMPDYARAAQLPDLSALTGAAYPFGDQPLALVLGRLAPETMSVAA